ncbi:MAG: serine/threonine protein phosphatase, partial [Peptococcaceae bacterium]|nr:serine/threonine protein phosphatase [Peptococcaceae bacterium]
MALYAIGDLHLCLGAPKPMDIFGGAWVGYMEKLREGLSCIKPEDTTVLLGDLSWALSLDEAREDFAWINDIPGRKIIL